MKNCIITDLLFNGWEEVLEILNTNDIMQYWAIDLIAKKNFIVPFYGWVSTASRLQSNYEDAIFTTKFPEIPGTHLINLGRMKDWVDFGVN